MSTQDQDRIRQIEHASLRAWSALEDQPYDGWRLRYSKGYTGRANSVQALDRSILPIAQKIAYCEAWYRQRGLPTRFRLTAAMQPPDLDDILQQRGYRRYNETIVQTCDLHAHTWHSDDRFYHQPQVRDRWLTRFAILNALPSEHVATARAMLQQTTAQMCYGWLGQQAVGLAVRDGEWVGLFDIVVHPDYRQQGIGQALVQSLLAWGRDQGATHAYLQVVGANVPAIALYRKLGFAEHHRYWYRTDAD